MATGHSCDENKWFLSVMASCVDRVAERLAKTELLQATQPFEGSDIDSDEEMGVGKRKKRNNRGSRKRIEKRKRKSRHLRLSRSRRR